MLMHSANCRYGPKVPACSQAAAGTVAAKDDYQVAIAQTSQELEGHGQPGLDGANNVSRSCTVDDARSHHDVVGARCRATADRQLTVQRDDMSGLAFEIQRAAFQQRRRRLKGLPKSEPCRYQNQIRSRAIAEDPPK